MPVKNSLRNLQVCIGSAMILLFSGAAGLFGQAPQLQADPLALDEEGRLWVDSVYNRLNLEERIAQLFMVRAYSNRGEEHTDVIGKLIRREKIGGICFFQGGPVRQAMLTNRYQELSDLPLLIAQDGEWGLGMRLDSTLSFPRQMTLGAVQDDDLIYLMGLDIARQFRRIGVHVNLAPVVDVNNNPANPVINSRSFGENRMNVARKGVAYARGLQDGGVMAVAKHFPGHGDTGTDSHYTLPKIAHNRERLDSVELFPFKYMIDRGIQGIMTAHLFIPSLDPVPDRASTLSPLIVDSLLRKQMGFRGLIFTDALDMKGVSIYDDPGEVDAQAFMAGNDVLLLSLDVQHAINVIRRAIRRNELDERSLEYSCKKVLAAKYLAGLNRYEPVSTAGLADDLNTIGSDLLKRKLVRQSLTVLQNRDQLLPLKELEKLKIATLSIGAEKENAFQQTLSLYAAADHYTIAKDASPGEFRAMLALLGKYNLVIAGIHGTNEIPSRNFGITKATVSFIDSLVLNNRVVLALFSNPYGLSLFRCLEDAAALLVSYEDSPYARLYSAQVIFGGLPASGRLPVSGSPLYPAGSGTDLKEKIRLSYTIPEEAGMDSGILARIDSIAGRAISSRATPGCQVLVARNGAVVFHKAYGFHTYNATKPVSTTDLYDLASITKIAATLPVIMQMKEAGLIGLNDSLGKYLPGLDSTDKGPLVLIDILTHQARLNGWVPFYQHTFELLDPAQALFSRKLSDDYPFKLDDITYLNRNYQVRKGVFSLAGSDSFPFQVAANMYMKASYRDTVFALMQRSQLREKKEYRYSDIGFYYFREIFEKKTGMSLRNYAEQYLYASLGATSLGYRPLERFSSAVIVPTENDIVFRKQLLHGYVHDPGAAMLGGVAGHAGLFGNANDLAKLMQVYLDSGRYGGKQYYEKKTLELFTSAPFRGSGNRRGIGFDKPETDPKKEGPTCKEASPSSFGHTGFTGTMAWADPEYGLLYIFLSNRVHPNQYNNRLMEMNIRTEIQKVMYDALPDRTHAR